MSEKLILDRVDKSFFWEGSHVEVLKNCSLYVDDFEFVSLLGPSGCGKSTVLKLVSGLVKPDKGTISFSPTLKKVSFMPQDDLLLPWRTVMDNTCIPLEIAGVAKTVARERVRGLMELFGLQGFETSYPYQLSGGMRQRVAVMRTFLHQGDIFLLDEPFGRLDAITRLKMQMWLMRVWQEFRQSVLFVTHDIEEAIFLSDRIYILSERPGTVKEEVQVNLPRPRGAEILTAPEFVAQKRLILSML